MVKVEKRSASSTFKAIDDLLRTPGGHCETSIDYMSQSSWLLFLRYLDAREVERRDEAEMRGVEYEPALPPELAWSTWAYPRDKEGKFDDKRALKGDDLLKFVKETLFPGLRALRDTATSIDSIQYRIGGIFSDLECLFKSGHTLRDVIDLIEPLSFQTEEDRHELTELYEERLSDMGNAGRNGGQYYTPRPLIRVMVRILNPKLGEKFYDGSCGSAGFLCEGFSYMRERTGNRSGAWEQLQKATFYGQEVMSIPYVTAQMNCILHGLETPNIVYGDTLAIKIANFTDKDRVDVIATNPPFGAKVEKTAKTNFVTQSSESAYLFMEHYIEKLREGGRAAIVIKNTLLSNSDNASVYIRKQLIEKCQLEMVLDLPQKVFAAGVKAVVLFFRKGGPTKKPIKFYELDLGEVSLGKTRPLNESDLAEFEQIARGKKSGKDCPSFWTVDPATIDRTTYDLSVRNPNKKSEKVYRTPGKIVAEMAKLDKKNAALLADIMKVLG